MGGMSERERVRRASAPAVCRYFYQHELGKGRGEEEEAEVWRGGQTEGERQNVGEMDKGGHMGDAGQWEKGVGGRTEMQRGGDSGGNSKGEGENEEEVE